MIFKKLQEKSIEALIRSCGVLSTFIVMLIILFLFKEASGLFNRSPLEEGFGIALHPANTVSELSPFQVRQIVEQNIKNWKDLGGEDLAIEVVSFNKLEKYFKEEELGNDLELLPAKILELVLSKKGAFVILPKEYLPKELRLLELDNINLGNFLLGEDWYPTAQPVAQLGVLPIILGTLWVTLGAMIFALPVGIGVAIYLAEIADKNVKKILKPIIELLAGIPSIVYGFIGLVIIVPFLQDTFELAVGETALAGSILLAIISLPTIISLSDDAIRSVPKPLKEASLALGANHWQSITRVILPYATSGIASACILGVGRSVGETMAVLMVTGNAAIIPTSFLEPVRTITATIAAELGEAPQGGMHYEALFMLGVILFIFTYIINLVASIISMKKNLVR
ncbi:MAG: phosphate ABC transporter permease subunit PstC [Flammeovirgaceae bacterium]